MTWFFCGKEKEANMVGCSFMPFLDFWKERNSRAFDNEGQSIQGLKSSFACNLWAWCKMHLVSLCLIPL